MSIPDDLDVSKPTAYDAEAARTLSRRLDALAREVEAMIDRFSLDAGAVVRGARERMALARNDLDSEAMTFAQLAAALAEQRTAGDAWERDAPKRADFEAAVAEIDAARAAMKQAADAEQPTAAAARRFTAAEQALTDLRNRRAAADEDYERACQRAEQRLGRGKCKPVDPRILDSGTPDAPAPGAPAPAPSPLPGTPSPPSTRIAAATTQPAAAPAPVAPLAAATVPATAATTHPAAHGPMPTMPTVMPNAAPAPAQRRDEQRPAADLGDLLSGTEMPSAAAAAVVTSAAPRPAGVTSAPAAPVTSPAPAPGTSGFSRDGMVTDAPVSGRSTRTPTGLSASHAVQQVYGGGTEAGTARAAGAPMAAPMMPGMGGMQGGGSGGGSARDREPVRSYSPLGMESMGEAVPYSIARRDKKAS